MNDLLRIGTRVIFIKDIIDDACGDHPALLWASEGVIMPIEFEEIDERRVASTAHATVSIQDDGGWVEIDGNLPIEYVEQILAKMKELQGDTNAT